MVAPLEYSSGLNPTKIGSSTDSSIIPNSCVGLIGHGQRFARVEVLGSRRSPEDDVVADRPSPKFDRCRVAEGLCEALPFSCPFRATTTGNARQRPAQGETENALDSFGRAHAGFSNSQQGSAKHGYGDFSGSLQKPSRTSEVKPDRVRRFAARAWPLVS